MLDFLKSLTSYLIDKKKLDDLDLTKMSERSLIDRVLSYYYNYPYIIEYFDTYMNIQNYDVKDILESIKIVGLSNGITSAQQLYFLKSTDDKDDIGPNIKKIIFNYYKKINNKHLNDSELKSLYNLYLNNIISNDDILQMSKLIKYDKPIKQKEQLDDIKEKIIQTGDFEFPIIPKHIKTFCNNLKQGFEKRIECTKCKLFGNPSTILDTNMSDFGPVDVIFIALNPGKDEVVPSVDRPLVGKAGKYFRKYLLNFPKNTKWVMTNIIMCHTKNQAEIGETTDKILKVAKSCNENLRAVLNKFPCKFYVTMGGPAMEMFRITGSVKGKSGKIYDVNNFKIAPIPHPSAAMQYGGDLEESFELGIKVISEYLHSFKKEEDHIQLTKQPINIESSTNNREDQQLTYINTTKLNDDQILNTYLDNNGNKILKIEKNEMPVYVKVSSFENLGYLDTPTHVCYLTGSQKRELDKLIKESIEVNKNKCLK